MSVDIAFLRSEAEQILDLDTRTQLLEIIANLEKMQERLNRQQEKPND